MDNTIEKILYGSSKTIIKKKKLEYIVWSRSTWKQKVWKSLDITRFMVCNSNNNNNNVVVNFFADVLEVGFYDHCMHESNFFVYLSGYKLCFRKMCVAKLAHKK